MDRIETAINRGAQDLDVESSTYNVDDDIGLYPFEEFMPLNLYTSKTLVSLKLSFSGIEDPGFVCMPCLKVMTLVEVQFRDSVNLEKLISGCSVLEELTLVRDMNNTDHDFMRVRSESLKRFRFPLRPVVYCSSRVKATLEIDAPGLEHMSLGEDQFDIVALDLYSKVGEIPKFNNLSRLEAVFPSDLLQFLPAFLECCPNLKHLILNVVDCEEIKVFELIDVPRCLLSTLECVKIKRIYEWDEEVELKVASYFLENAAVLKKLILSLTPYPRHVLDSEIYKEVTKVTKRSPRCQIILDWDLLLQL